MIYWKKCRKLWVPPQCFVFGVRNKEREKIHEFSAALNMTVGNTFIIRRGITSFIYDSYPLKGLVDYCL